MAEQDSRSPRDNNPENPGQGGVAPILSVEFDSGCDVDAVLEQVAGALRARGRRVAGLVQRRGRASGDCNCRDLDLLDLKTGRYHRISEDRGALAEGCHLDWQAIVQLAGELEQGLDAETDVLIINRFGRSESEGRGFRTAIERAIEMGIPVVVAVQQKYLDPWRVFHGGLARPVRPVVPEILRHLPDN